MLEPIAVMGKIIEVKIIRAPIKNSYARIRDGYLVISLPERMSEKSAMKAAEELHGRMTEALRKNLHRFMGMPKISFNDKDTITVLGEKFSINVLQTGNRKITVRMFNNSLYVKTPLFSDKDKSDWVIRRFIEGKALPALQEKISTINAAHFRSTIGVVRLRDNLTMWGSCSRNNSITLNFRLLHAPIHILEYVIVHELAHTRIRNHSDKFWSSVEAVIPDYKERRMWLRKNSHNLKPTFTN